MKLVSFGSAAFIASISASSRATGASVRRSRLPPSPGTDRSAPTSNRSFWMRASMASTSGAVARCQTQHADRGVRLVHRADRLDARRVLAQPRAVAERGLPRIAATRHHPVDPHHRTSRHSQLEHHTQRHVERDRLAILHRRQEAPGHHRVARRAVERTIARTLQTSTPLAAPQARHGSAGSPRPVRHGAPPRADRPAPGCGTWHRRWPGSRAGR